MQTSDLIKGASSSTNLTQGTISTVVTRYTQWVISELIQAASSGKSLTFPLFGVIHVGTPGVSYNLASSQPEPYNIYQFVTSTNYGYTFDEVSSVVSSFHREIIKSLLTDGKATLQGVGRVHLSSDNRVVFSLSSTLSSKSPITSRVNSAFRSEFNAALSAHLRSSDKAL